MDNSSSSTSLWSWLSSADVNAQVVHSSPPQHESWCGGAASEAACTLEIFSVLLVAMSIVLLFHHRYKHRSSGPHPLHGVDRWFQRDDACVFWPCNHETWIICLLLLAFVLILTSFAV